MPCPRALPRAFALRRAERDPKRRQLSQIDPRKVHANETHLANKQWEFTSQIGVYSVYRF